MKTRLDSVSRLRGELERGGWEPGLAQAWYQEIVEAKFRGKNLALAAVATEICHDEQPLTLRGLFYQVVSAGWLPSTDRKHYDRLGRLLCTLRETSVLPFEWIVDNMRQTVKPSSWSGLQDFTETVRNAYRKDFWEHIPNYVHVFCEKDAIAGVIQPVTYEFDVALSPCRGYASLSFVHEIARTFERIEKPIHCFYLGDWDASGMGIEEDLRGKLERYQPNKFTWQRLGVLDSDFEELNLLELAPKESDRRTPAFVERYGSRCAEVDAIPASELRLRVRNAIEQFIPWDEWESLKRVEELERESFHAAFSQLRGCEP